MEELDCRLRSKRQDKERRDRRKLEKKLKKAWLTSTIEEEFPELSPEEVESVKNLLSGDVIGGHFSQMW